MEAIISYLCKAAVVKKRFIIKQNFRQFNKNLLFPCGSNTGLGNYRFAWFCQFINLSISNAFLSGPYFLYYFDEWIHLGIECCVPFVCHGDLDIWPHFNNYCVWSISRTLFEVGIQNILCGCIGDVPMRQHVTFHFWVTVTMTSFLE